MIFQYGKYEISRLSAKLFPGRDVDSIEWETIGYEKSQTLSEEFHLLNIRVK